LTREQIKASAAAEGMTIYMTLVMPESWHQIG
jgi:hypothetical protein